VKAIAKRKSLRLADDLAVPLELDESYEQSCGIPGIAWHRRLGIHVAEG
jgi:hypothetical protein